MWLEKVKAVKGDDLQVNWRYFSLAQASQPPELDIKVWEQPDDYPTKGLWAMRAGEAARRQGTDAFHRVHMNLLEARHVARKNIDDPQVLVEVARQSGLAEIQFRKDLHDRGTLHSIARDHTEAVKKHGVFGTPTFVMDGRPGMFLKMLEPPAKDAGRVFEILVELMQSHMYIGEVKRPQPPWPSGAYDK